MAYLVYPKLSGAGLGNLLLVWARATLFAEINSLPIIAPDWGKIRIGPYLRGEREKRFYGNLFSNKGYTSKFQYFLTNFGKRCFIENPTISKFDSSKLKLQRVDHYIFVFDTALNPDDYFVDLKEHQPFIKQKMFANIRPSIFRAISKSLPPEIGIHVRLSDFRIAQSNESCIGLGNVRIPISWYITNLQKVRAIAGYDIPATVFSDGHDDELSELLQLPNVSRSPKAPALADMLTLAKSNLLIASSSTFSGWASYIGQCPTIWHPAYCKNPVFSSQIRQNIFEGGFEPESMSAPNLLIRNIESRFKLSL